MQTGYTRIWCSRQKVIEETSNTIREVKKGEADTMINYKKLKWYFELDGYFILRKNDLVTKPKVQNI